MEAERADVETAHIQTEKLTSEGRRDCVDDDDRELARELECE